MDGSLQMPVVMNLENLSRYLVEFQRQRYEDLEIPGQYLQPRDAVDNKDFVRIDRFHPVVHTVRKVRVTDPPTKSKRQGGFPLGAHAWSPSPVLLYFTPLAPCARTARHIVPSPDDARHQRPHVPLPRATLELAPRARRGAHRAARAHAQRVRSTSTHAC